MCSKLGRFPLNIAIMASGQICDIDPKVLEKLKQFRFAKKSKGNAAYVFEEDEMYDDITMEDLVDVLPENSPRYIVLSYELHHHDGRNSFPLVFIYWSPNTVKSEMHMLYAGVKTYLQSQADVSKVSRSFGSDWHGLD
ncbi:hypothetical protein BC936DRAFT_137462 [Jimgerdemannia flammicorona]|uniref:ADF-H domain-containing protein n=1 Tax=Jimgerdemannia flammicorona TaxID=994334 RepID=A0A433CXB7_9FUNG|nr:hypothetical protein BC936DRAFT_137462 [Jimgerdemannia flammicorona]